MFLVYGGIGLTVRSPWVLILMLPLATTIRYGFSEHGLGPFKNHHHAPVRVVTCVNLITFS